jgi:hypothetical protein
VFTDVVASGKKNSRKSRGGSEVSVATSAVTAIELLRALVEATLRRSSAFSSVLLGEAVRLLPLSGAVLVLRVVTLLMRGLCHSSSSFPSATTPAGASQSMSTNLPDEQIKRAITWIEAVLDGHFSAMALHAVSSASTRRALMLAMETVNGVEDATEGVQAALGLWTHIDRVVHHGGQQVNRALTTLYQVESLALK